MDKTSLKKNNLLQNLDEEINLNKLFRIISRSVFISLRVILKP